MIEIFGTAACTFCVKAKQLCELKHLEYQYIDVKASPDALPELERRVGGTVKTVPQIFIDGEYIVGGFTGLSTHLAMADLVAKF